MKNNNYWDYISCNNRKQDFRNCPDRFDYRKNNSGNLSNQIITARNDGVKHQFLDDIAGSSSNYK